MFNVYVKNIHNYLITHEKHSSCFLKHFLFIFFIYDFNHRVETTSKSNNMYL